ncbi:hypothetical protein RM553_18915 [Zunongwangia sp. F363]|uniref:Uncharacterized protein n=1 Tax=Autumnicola tepida TaxID=3075595 RepID=A0ABU3CEZ0_9FLAO|nr:hypothetical protein [Zunongwangia sp. F363]MDT0644917.1 hypothetical protein [Zunongwangia sp. F363]
MIDNNITDSLLFGLSIWIGVIVFFIGVGFTSEEYIIRKKRIKKLYSENYSFLDENNFILHHDLYFEGKYIEFWFRVYPIAQRQQNGQELEYYFIEACYELTQENKEREEKLSGNYFLGKLTFSNNCAGYIPKNWSNPDFKEEFDGLISIFDYEKLKPLSKNDWEEIYGKKIKEEKLREEKSRAKQILKIGKLDIKYIKPEKQIRH